MSKIILGTAQLGLDYGISNCNGKPSINDSFELLKRAYELGIFELDTAFVYGNSQQIISEFQNNEKKFFKVYTKFQNICDIINELKKGHELFGTNSFEAVSFHNFNDYYNFNSFDELYAAKKKYKIKKIGVSVYDNIQIEYVLEKNNIDFIQIPFNCFDNDYQRGIILNKVKDLNIEVHCRSVFLQGLFYLNGDQLKGKLSSFSSSLNWFHNLKDEYDLSIEELCLSYVNSKPYIDKIVMGVANLNQLNTNFISLNTVKLPEELIKKIDNFVFNKPELLLPVNWS